MILKYDSPMTGPTKLLVALTAFAGVLLALWRLVLPGGS